MSYTDAAWFNNIERPSRYLGGEIRSIVKDLSRVKLSVALAFPDVYEVGMSHVGLKILYALLNKEEWIAAERVFCPWTDLERALRQNAHPLLSLETGRPLREFDMVGFSLQHELCYTNVLTMLDLGGIPLLRHDRSEKDPIVIGGGPMCFNPEPVADIFDLFLVGDGEESLPQICRIMKEVTGRRDRYSLLKELSSVRGVYVPSMFEPCYDEKGVVRAIRPVDEGYALVRKAVVSDLDLLDFPNSQVIPFTQLVHDRLAIEIARGCTRGCRFCQAGIIYRPVRERSMASVLKTAGKALADSGYEELSLLSLSSGDHSCIELMLKSLMDRHSGDKVALSLPSLRVDTVSPVFMEQIKRVRKTGFTLAVEAGSERLRRIINKGLTTDEILRMATQVYGAGWNLIKLYFMVGLPFEQDADVKEIVQVAKEISALAPGRRGGDHLNVSVATFVPKAHTPFMWARQADIGEATEKIAIVRSGLKNERVKVKWNPPALSWLEGVFSRGDRRLGKTLLEAWKNGARFDGWSELFRKDIWDDAFSATGVDPFFYISREREEQEVFPWEHIRSGVKREFLLQEWRRAKEGRLTPDCRKACLDCGVCDHERIMPSLKTDNSVPLTENTLKKRDNTIPCTYRLFFAKTGAGRFIGHLEMVHTFLRALRRARIPIDYSRGFHPMPKVSFSQALPLGTESLQEWTDLQLTRRVPERGLLEAMNRELPSFLRITEARLISDLRAGKEIVRESHYRVRLLGHRASEDRLHAFKTMESFHVKRASKDGTKMIDARPFIKDIRIVSPELVEIELLHVQGPTPRPAEIMRTVFSLPDDCPMRILKTRQISGLQAPNDTQGGE